MNGQEDQSKNQGRTESTSTAAVVQLLTSILGEVQRQQVQTRVIAQLQGDADRAVKIFQEIDAALRLTTGGMGGDSEVSARRPRGRGRRNVS